MMKTPPIFLFRGVITKSIDNKKLLCFSQWTSGHYSCSKFAQYKVTYFEPRVRYLRKGSI